MASQSPKVTLLHPHNAGKSVSEPTSIVFEHLEKAGFSPITEERALKFKQNVQSLIQSAAREHGLLSVAVNVTAEEDRIKVSAIVSDVSVNKLDVFHRDYLELGPDLGLIPSWLGRPFCYKGTVLVVDGLDTSKEKPYLRAIRVHNGQTIKIKVPLSEGVPEKLKQLINEYKGGSFLNIFDE